MTSDAASGGPMEQVPDAVEKAAQFPKDKPAQPQPSWTIPGPVIFTASDPESASNKISSPLSVAKIVPNTEGVNPLWRVDRDGRIGGIAQVEGQGQVAQALAKLAWCQQNGYTDFAVVTTLGSETAHFLQMGVNVAMVECYAQAGDYPFADLHRMTWQATHDGWAFAIPIVGVYDEIGLSHYDLHDWGHEFGIYLAEGMGDTNSWPDLEKML